MGAMRVARFTRSFTFVTTAAVLASSLTLIPAPASAFASGSQGADTLRATLVERSTEASDVVEGVSVPVSAGIPLIVGDAIVGSVVTAQPGEWTAGATFSYQWQADGVAISGATTATFRVPANVAGKALTVVVTGSLEGHEAAEATSAPTTKVLALLTTAIPAIGGTATVGQQLAATTTGWTAGTTLSYQWLANGTAISGATGSTLKLSASVIGKTITVKVLGAKPGHAGASVISRATAPVRGVLIAPTPTIAGTPTVGQKLTAKPGVWVSGTAFTYQWFANGVAISGATNATLVLPASVAAKTISVTVSGTKSGYVSAAKRSVATAKVLAALTSPSPTIAGVAQVGQKLTAKSGTWTSGAVLKYQWYANGSAISGATASTLSLSSSMIGKRITVTVSGSKSGYASVAKTSAASAAVRGLLTTRTPSISGTVTAGKTLSAKPGSWTSGTSFAYQWYVNGKAISGASKSTLVLTTAMSGKKITVKVTGSKANYITASMTSAATANVAYPSRTSPDSAWNCPSWAPIKGNQSGIFHVPGGRYYDKTSPEECFSTSAAAIAAGYRAPKN